MAILQNIVVPASGGIPITTGVFGGGDTSAKSNVIDYITIQTTGNGTDFGDLTSGRYGPCGSAGA